MLLADGGMSDGRGLDIQIIHQLLCARLYTCLQDVPPVLRTDLLAVLALEGKLCHQPALPLDGRWALVPFCLAHALCTEVDPGESATVAVAVECLICATDLLDDVMDEDRTPLIERLGEARTVNVALAFLSLPQRLLLTLPGHSVPLRLLDALQQALLQAVGGQQQDLLAERRPAWTLSLEDCLAIAEAKAGSLLGLACRLAALCAGVQDALVERCTELGRLLGIAAQLENDAHDLSRLLQGGESGKSDLRRGKKTLPVVLAAHALRATHPQEAEEMEQAVRQLPLLVAEKRQIYLAALHEGILTTWGLSLLYRERARECCRTLVGDGPQWADLCEVLGLAEAPGEITT
jgi:geranylgeranyl pyrophosphate synthase